jgi:hypothetical protein
VKSLSKRNPVPLGTSLERIMGDYWIIINNLLSDPVAYVMEPSEVKGLAHKGEKDGRISFWLQPTAYDKKNFREAWHRIGNPNKDPNKSVERDRAIQVPFRKKSVL